VYPSLVQWRSPEEYYDKPLNEKIDIWSLGNNFYGLLTGLAPFYELKHSEDVKQHLKKKEKSFIDPRYRERSYVERKLAEIIELCWEYEPDKRIDIHTLVKLLRDVSAENGKLTAVGSS
jgi:serine/threonine protein kinase